MFYFRRRWYATQYAQFTRSPNLCVYLNVRRTDWLKLLLQKCQVGTPNCITRWMQKTAGCKIWKKCYYFHVYQLWDSWLPITCWCRFLFTNLETFLAVRSIFHNLLLHQIDQLWHVQRWIIWYWDCLQIEWKTFDCVYLTTQRFTDFIYNCHILQMVASY